MNIQDFEIQAYLRNMSYEDIKRLWDKPLYQILRYDYVLDILSNNRLTFVNIQQSWWEEPYELCMFRPQYTLQGKSVDISEVAGHFYAQCWSTNRNSNAMWKIYSDHHDGVRIQTTFGEIIQLLYTSKTPLDLQELIPYFGKIQYLKQTKIKNYIANFDNTPISNWLDRISDSLFAKRDNFLYEKEYRILFSEATIDKNNQKVGIKNMIQYPIDAQKFIKEITFDPESDIKINKKRKKELQSIVGDRIKIYKSRLYLHDLEPLHINLTNS